VTDFSTDPKSERGPAATIKAVELMRAAHENASSKATSAAERRHLTGAIASLDEMLISLVTKQIKLGLSSATCLREIDDLTDRGRVMAKLAQKIGRGSDSIYHGTRHLADVLRCGKLLPPLIGEHGIFLSRSPATAAYFATLWGPKLSDTPQAFWCSIEDH